MLSLPLNAAAPPAIIAVIPALNAQARMPACLAALDEGLRSGVLRAIILSDGGSTDETLSVARRAGCAVLSATRSRGGQIAAGVEAARRLARIGDGVLVLHADTVLEPGWTAPVQAALADARNRPRAFHFRFALDDPAPRARRLERQVNWRAERLRLPYGDQGLLIPFAMLDALGGYRPWPLFEDVDIVRRIGRNRLAALPVRAVTSAERFQREGYLARSSRNLLLLARYFTGARPDALARAYRSRR